jgi:hypothetical protein
MTPESFILEPCNGPWRQSSVAELRKNEAYSITSLGVGYRRAEIAAPPKTRLSAPRNPWQEPETCRDYQFGLRISAPDLRTRSAHQEARDVIQILGFPLLLRRQASTVPELEPLIHKEHAT